MEIFVPEGLAKTARESGAEGTDWLDSLPERIAALERAWGFHVGPALDHGGAVSWVAPVACEDGSQAILKIGRPHHEARFEADALRFLDGAGTVRLLRASDDGFALLLERCVPGTDLWALSEEEGDAVAARLLPRFWREPEPDAPFLPLTEMVAQWRAEMPAIAAAGGYDMALVAQALALGQELAASQPQRVLLHGDFHPGNVLAAQREPWLVIDPKPLTGDPAYDLAQWLGNRYDAAILSADPVSVLRGQIARFAGRLGLNPARIAGWAWVKSVGWKWGPEAVALFHRLYRAVSEGREPEAAEGATRRQGRERTLFRLEIAALQDAETLARIQTRAFAEDAAMYGVGPPGYDSAEWQIEAIGRDRYYKILAADRIVGGVLASDQGGGHYYLHRLFVDPDFQNRGAASQAMAFLEGALPATRWTLHTPHRSFANQRFYERRGYRKIGEERVEMPGLAADFTLFLYEKTLPDPPG